MDEIHLYHQIAESIRREILEGHLNPGDSLPSIRQMTVKWGCTPGTVHRAYQELARQQLVVSRVGQGTRVTGSIVAPGSTPLRKALLVNRAESFLLEVLTAGHTPSEVEQAFQLALDRWKTIKENDLEASPEQVHFIGSHDLAFNWLVSQFNHNFPQDAIQVNYAGSLGGLIALVEGRAIFAGCHLWDEESDTYNLQYVRRLLPARKVAIITLAHRRLGLIIQPGNPLKIYSLEDLQKPQVRFVNRQRGSGTRVWLDAHLSLLGIDPDHISGYEIEKITHSELAQHIANGHADAGLGLEAAALAFGLDFLFLTREKYDLIIPQENMGLPQMQKFLQFLQAETTRAGIFALGGYDTSCTGTITYSE